MIDPHKPTLLDYQLLRDQATAHFAETAGKVACGPGCSDCCSQFIAASFADALVIARHLLISGRASDAKLLERLQEDAKEQSTTGPVEWLSVGRACAFLVDNRCSIYSVRPLNCRQVLVRGSADRCAPEKLYQIAIGTRSRDEIPVFADWTGLIPVGVMAQEVTRPILRVVGLGDLPPAPLPAAVLAALHFLVTGSASSLETWAAIRNQASTQPTTPGENGNSETTAESIQREQVPAGNLHSISSFAP